MKHLTIIALILVASVKTAFTQPHGGVKESAQLCADALMRNDYATVFKFTYPKLIEEMGGREQFLNTIKQKMSGMSEKGIVIKKIVIGEIGKKYKAGTETYCLVPETLSLKITGGTLEAKSYLLAISVDNGKSWFFIDTSSVPADKAEFKKLFPHFNNNLIIPPPSQPVFHKDADK
jgi:hypothetical protein